MKRQRSVLHQGVSKNAVKNAEDCAKGNPRGQTKSPFPDKAGKVFLPDSTQEKEKWRICCFLCFAYRAMWKCAPGGRSKRVTGKQKRRRNIRQGFTVKSLSSFTSTVHFQERAYQDDEDLSRLMWYTLCRDLSIYSGVSFSYVVRFRGKNVYGYAILFIANATRDSGS
jgi:hypothetical protein